jgi:hypothetical protein
MLGSVAAGFELEQADRSGPMLFFEARALERARLVVK